MTDRFSPSLPINGTVKVSLVRRVAGVVGCAAWRWAAPLRAALSGPALILWRFDYRALRLGIAVPDQFVPASS